MATKKRKLHEIPEFYLRGFCEPDSSFVWVFSRLSFFAPGKKLGSNNPAHRGVGVTALRPDGYRAQTAYYGSAVDYEVELAKIESKANRVIAKLRAFARIDVSEKETLADYIFLMDKRRTKRDEDIRPRLEKEIAKETSELRSFAGRLADYGQFNPARRVLKVREYLQTEAGHTEILRKSMINNVGMVRKGLTAKRWQFIKSAPGSYFVTSDNPVVFDRGFGLRRSPLIFPLAQNLILLADDSTNEDFSYRDASPEETRKHNAAIIIFAD